MGSKRVPKTKTSAVDSRVDLLDRNALPPFAALRAFEAVGRLGGIRKAAQTLGIHHAVVSRHIRFLEEWLGVPLFLRDGRRASFTEAGATYHARVSRTLAELASATSDLMNRSARSYLLLWCVPGFAAQWVSEQIGEFEKAFPQIPVELRPTDTAANLLMYEADVDIRYYGDDYQPPAGGRGLYHVELARPPVMAVASPVVAQKISKYSLADLANGPLLHEEHHEQWRAWFRCNGLSVPEQLPGPLLWHAHLALAAARSGRGVALGSTYLVGADLERGSLVEVKIRGARNPVLGAYAFVVREDRWSSPAIAQLRRFLIMRAGRT